MEKAALPMSGPEPPLDGLSAESFRGFERALEDTQLQEARDLKSAAAKAKQAQIESMIDGQISGEAWQALLKQAHEAAKQGAKQYLLLRFPSGLCTDSGRAINNPPNAAWPQTLRGEAAAIYGRWHDSLRSLGFGLFAHVLDFPDGKPGDVGLILHWSE